MKEYFNILPLKGLKPTDIEAYRQQSGLPPDNRRLMHFFLSGLMAERAERLRLIPRYRPTAAAVPHAETVVETCRDHGTPAQNNDRTAEESRITPLTAAREGQPAHVFSLAAWQRAKGQQAANTEVPAPPRRALAKSRPVAAFEPQPLGAAFEEERAHKKAVATMMARARLANFLQRAGVGYFGGDQDTLETVMCFVLAEPVICNDFQTETPGRAERSRTYTTLMAHLASQSMRVAKDIEYLNSPNCAPETRALFLLRTYDLLANQLATRAQVATLVAGERAHTAKLCYTLERLPSTDMLTHTLKGEARRVRLMIMDDRSTSRELKREMGAP